MTESAEAYGICNPVRNMTDTHDTNTTPIASATGFPDFALIREAFCQRAATRPAPQPQRIFEEDLAEARNCRRQAATTGTRGTRT
jgi:hypothetical protein